MIEWPHIEQFHQVLKLVEHANESVPSLVVKGPVRYLGTPKLHGVNAGVRITFGTDGNDTCVPQSRTRELSVEDDLKGFAKFASDPEVMATLKAMGELCLLDWETEDRTITLFGEWVGEGIEDGVAVGKLPKHFVVIGALLNDGTYITPLAIEPPDNSGRENVYNIAYTPELSPRISPNLFEITIDFSSIESVKAAVEYMARVTDEVEKKCPWAEQFGVEGLGEGIVWAPTGEHEQRIDLMFKTKGELHKVVKSKERIQLAPETLQGLQEFVDFSLPTARLEQGLRALEANGTPLELKSMGAYLQWIVGDVERECKDELEKNNIDWKLATKELTRKARDFFKMAVAPAA